MEQNEDSAYMLALKLWLLSVVALLLNCYSQTEFLGYITEPRPKQQRPTQTKRGKNTPMVSCLSDFLNPWRAKFWMCPVHPVHVFDEPSFIRCAALSWDGKLAMQVSGIISCLNCKLFLFFYFFSFQLILNLNLKSPIFTTEKINTKLNLIVLITCLGAWNVTLSFDNVPSLLQ